MVKKKGNKKAEKKAAKELRAVKRILEKKVTSRRIIRPSQATVVIKQQKIESAFDEPSRFFKGEMEAARKSMFF